MAPGPALFISYTFVSLHSWCLTAYLLDENRRSCSFFFFLAFKNYTYFHIFFFLYTLPKKGDFFPILINHFVVSLRIKKTAACTMNCKFCRQEREDLGNIVGVRKCSVHFLCLVSHFINDKNMARTRSGHFKYSRFTIDSKLLLSLAVDDIQSIPKTWHR